jgi:3-oxoacyl-(acyl-carrier-protein) synthase
MSVFIQGIGAVTPLAPTARETWRPLCEGQQAPRRLMTNAVAGRKYFSCTVPGKFVSEVAREPRLRRSGTLSLLGAAAGFDALADAGMKSGRVLGDQMAVVFAICSGGVNYTRRFYHEIVTQGAKAASPLLFPETVYNAAASHLAALLEIDGQSYTLVGDSSIGLSALHFATQLLTMQPGLDRCLVVGTEEADWLLADAFASWRMATNEERFEVYGRTSGTIFGEGAAAVLIGRTGALEISRSSPGQAFFSVRDCESVAAELFGNLLTVEPPDLIVGSANGTFADEVELKVFGQLCPSIPVYAPKPAVGEALGASALFQVAVAVLAIRHQQVPGTLSAGFKLPSVNRESRSFPVSNALVTSVGFNQQVNAVKLRLP